MWPWEHLAVSYVAYSIYVHLRYRDAPRTAVLVALGFGALFPDLVDKPLSWTFGILPSGTSLAHSVFVAVPLAVGVWLAAGAFGRSAEGGAFGFGYLFHLPCDAIYGTLLYGGGVSVAPFLWPLVEAPAQGSPGFFSEFLYYLGRFRTHLFTPYGIRYLLFEFLMLAGAFALWLVDGTPGLRWIRRTARE